MSKWRRRMSRRRGRRSRGARAANSDTHCASDDDAGSLETEEDDEDNEDDEGKDDEDKDDEDEDDETRGMRTSASVWRESGAAGTPVARAPGGASDGAIVCPVAHSYTTPRGRGVCPSWASRVGFDSSR